MKLTPDELSTIYAALVYRLGEDHPLVRKIEAELRRPA